MGIHREEESLNQSGRYFIPYDFTKFLRPDINSNILHCLIFEQLFSGTILFTFLMEPLKT